MSACRILLFLLTTTTTTRAAIQLATTNGTLPDPVLLSIPRDRPYFVTLTKIAEDVSSSSLYSTHHRGAYLVRTNYPWSIVLPRPNDDDDDASLLLHTTLTQAQENHCDVAAINGGPFNRDGWNTGPTVVAGQLVRTRNNSITDCDFVGIGTIQERGDTTHHSSWILGSYHQFVSSSNGNNNNNNHKIWNFVTGFQWLIYEGQILANNSHNPTGAARAARTAVGIDRDSNLMLLEVDGCEKCVRRRGLTLEELAHFLVAQGAQFAINMDGGGSSTLVRNMNTVINRPLCLDIPYLYCQRPVASVLCVSSPSHSQG